MLKSISKRKNPPLANGRFAVVAARYNARYVDGMLRAAKQTFQQAGLRKSQLQIFRVPGAFEIPAVAAKLAAVSHNSAQPLDAVLCLAVILQGDTQHAQHIAIAVSQALAALQTDYFLPIIHQVLLFNTPDQARQRCLSDPKHNRGAEAASTALQMSQLMRSIPSFKENKTLTALKPLRPLN